MKFRFHRRRRPSDTGGTAHRRAVRWHGDSVVNSGVGLVVLAIIAVVTGTSVIDQKSGGVALKTLPPSLVLGQNSSSGDDSGLTRPRWHAPTDTPRNAVKTTPTATAAQSQAARAAAARTAAPRTPSPSTPHVMVIMEENKGYAATLGSCAADPYFCSLAATYASDTSWFGVSHPSAPNYVGFASGSTQGISNDCTPPSCGPFNVPSLGGQLSAAGIPWRAYMESMPGACSTSGSSGLYAEKHNPFLYFNDVRAAANCAAVEQPYPGVGGLVSALTGAGAPDFVWITPNLANDMHDGSVSAGDAWLTANLAPVLASTWFTGGNATVIVTMDEGPSANQIPMVVISSKARGAGAVTVNGNHYGALRSIERVYGLGLLGGAASAANGDLSGLFG